MFLIHSADDGRVPGIEYLPCGAITPKAGMALVQSGGLLTAAAGSGKPAYISMCEREEACEEGDIIPVIRVQSDMIFETALSAEGAGLKLGDRVTVADGGLLVTATTADGVAELVYMDGTEAGSTVRVRF